MDLGYLALAELARGAAALAPPGEAKVLRSLRARRGIRSRYRAWAKEHRDPARALLWMHAPSVGEGLQAQPVLQLMRARRPSLQLAYTHYSPSAAAFAKTLPVDFQDYLPFDTVGDARATLEALQPTALVFAKVDVWPTLCRVAHARGIRLGLISATLARASSRRTAGGSLLLRDTYALLDAVGVIDPADADRLVQLGVRPGVISITGDTRYDQVWARAQRVDRNNALLKSLRSTRPTLVAGSTWPSDDAILLPAWEAIRADRRHVRLIIAPHEPTPRHLAAVERWASQAQLVSTRLAGTGAEKADVIVVDRVGVLGDLYALADVAYVGGGFHGAGVHSVLEPAAFGAPVLFGPNSQNSRDAGLIAARSAGGVVTDSSQLARRLGHYLSDTVARRAAGEAARALVRAGTGAAERSFALVDRLLAGAD